MPASPPTDTLIRELHSVTAERTSPSRKAAAVERILSLLGQLAGSAEWRLIPQLLSITLDGRTEVARAAAHTVQELEALVPLGAIPQLDRSLRERSPWIHGEYGRWHELRADDLPRFTTLGGGSTMLNLAMCHPSGRVREAAIRLANVCSDGREAAYLLLRSNDWVVQVRRAAAAALRARLNAGSAPALLAALPLVDASKRWGRVDDSILYRQIEEFLASPEASAAMRTALTSQDRLVRRAAFRRALRSPSFEGRDVLDVALRDDDATVRLAAFRVLHETGDDVELRRLLPRLLDDSLGTIRSRALQLALGRGIEADLLRFLLDPHAATRALAQLELVAGDADVLEHYRARLQDANGHRLAAAVAGMTEVGGAEVADEVRRFVAHPAPPVRRAALRALGGLKVDDRDQLCLAALGDPAPSVSHAARDLLGSVPGIRPADVWVALKAGSELHGKLDALWVLGNLDFWERLPYLLQATGVAEVRERALRQLERWAALRVRRFTAPTASVLEASQKALGRAALQDLLRKEIERMLIEMEPSR